MRGETVRHRFEFVAAGGTRRDGVDRHLQITSDPSRAALVVDGVPRGVTPLMLPDLSAGSHTLAVRFAAATVEQRVDVVQGTTASVHVVAPQSSAAAAGWLSVDVASPLQIFEQDKLVGTTNIGRLLLSPGVHVLDFVSDELGFRAQRTVTVRPGAATDVRLDLPAVTLSVNAQPWAEVFVDGERVGETPIGTLVPSRRPARNPAAPPRARRTPPHGHADDERSQPDQRRHAAPLNGSIHHEAREALRMSVRPFSRRDSPSRSARVVRAQDDLGGAKTLYVNASYEEALTRPRQAGGRRRDERREGGGDSSTIARCASSRSAAPPRPIRPSLSASRPIRSRCPTRASSHREWRRSSIRPAPGSYPRWRAPRSPKAVS